MQTKGVIERTVSADVMRFFMTENKHLVISRPYWENMSSDELEKFAEEIFIRYRKKGFPLYDLTIEAQHEEITKMNAYCEKNEVLREGVLRQTMHCLNVAWTYFPHSWNVKCNNMITPKEAFEDDTKFRQVIRKRLKRGGYVSDSGIRKELRTSSGIQAVSNFRPTAARAVYDNYAGDGVVWDMSCGYGGRLLGALSSKRVKRYIGTEPDEATHKGLLSMSRNLGNETEIEIHKMGSEDFKPPALSIDLCFTSPPYYNTEKYSDSMTQSYMKYPEKQKWLIGFLMKTISNCVYGLKDGGYLIMNIASVKSYPKLTEDFMTKVNEMFPDLKLKEMLAYSLSSINKVGHKKEPVFVFKKDSNMKQQVITHGM